MFRFLSAQLSFPASLFRVRCRLGLDGTQDLLARFHIPGPRGRFRSAVVVGAGINDPNFRLQLVACLLQRMVLIERDAH